MTRPIMLRDDWNWAILFSVIWIIGSWLEKCQLQKLRRRRFRFVAMAGPKFVWKASSPYSAAKPNLCFPNWDLFGIFWKSTDSFFCKLSLFASQPLFSNIWTAGDSWFQNQTLYPSLAWWLQWYWCNSQQLVWIKELNCVIGSVNYISSQ